MSGRRQDNAIEDVTAHDGGPAVGVNYGTVAGHILGGNVVGLRDVVRNPSVLPGALRLETDKGAVAGFTPRGWLIDRIDKLIAQQAARPTGGYVLVDADAGMGKSALAVYLGFTRPWPAHYSRLSTSPEAARANLAAQVMWATRQVGEDDPRLPGNYTDPSWFADLLITVADQRRANGISDPLVLLVDGLDEAPAPPTGGLPFGLPKLLPKGVVIVATSRPGSRLPPGTPVERIDVESQNNLDDLERHVTFVVHNDPEITQALIDAGIPATSFVTSLLDKARGVWIYALSVLDQVRDGWSPALIGGLPPGLAGYYCENLRRWKAEWPGTWGTVTLPLIGTLAAAREPLPARTLAAWSGASLEQVRDLIDGPLRAFLAHTPGNAGQVDATGVYGLRHQSLRDLLAGRVSEDADQSLQHDAAIFAEATTEAHEHITVHLLPMTMETGIRDWSTASDYATDHLCDHAALAGRLDALVLDPGFLLWAPLSALRRLRVLLTTDDGRRAVNARELAASQWQSAASLNTLSLGAWAARTRCQPLLGAIADRVAGSGSAPLAAAWNGAAHAVLPGHTGSVQVACAVPLPDGRTLLATAGDDETVRLWDPTTLQPAGELPGHTDWVWAACAVPLPDGRTLLATAGDDKTVFVWELAPLAAQ